VTTFDPDGLVASANLGLVVSDKNSITSALHELLEDDDQRQVLAAVARDYFLKNHSRTAVVRKFLEFYGYVTGITRSPA
jgi:glycosyltransferase involved in cell wall biosynthesis